MDPTPRRVIDRLLSKYVVDKNGCWISLYSTGSHGYSQIGWAEGGKTKMRVGHRVSWEAHHGPVPDDMTIDHECRVRRCINPAHLRLLTNPDNARGGGGLHTGEPVALDRLCGKGLHPLLRYPSGAVGCRECAAERARRKWHRKEAMRKADTF